MCKNGRNQFLDFIGLLYSRRNFWTRLNTDHGFWLFECPRTWRGPEHLALCGFLNRKLLTCTVLRDTRTKFVVRLNKPTTVQHCTVRRQYQQTSKKQYFFYEGTVSYYCICNEAIVNVCWLHATFVLHIFLYLSVKEILI